MTNGPPADDDRGGGTPRVGTWAAVSEEQRIRQAVLRRVRRERHGKTTAAVAEELRHEFAAAGMPMPAEQVSDYAKAINEHRRPEAYFLGQLIDLAVHRRIPAGMRREEQRLPGGRWIAVQVAETAMARIALRNYGWLQQVTEQIDPQTPLQARLITMPGPGGREQIAVLLGDTFVGTLPPEHGDALIEVAEQADAADQRLIAGARIDHAGALLVTVGS